MSEVRTQTTSQHWRQLLQIGAIAGLVVLYVGVIGMVADLHEREIVDDSFTLGQLILFFPAFVGAYIATRRVQKSGADNATTLAGSVVIGVLAAVPTLILLFLNEQVLDASDVLVNVNRDWTEIITFDRDNLLTGALQFTALITGFGALGGAIGILPEKIRRALVAGVSITLVVGMFGETVGLILEQLIPEEVLDEILRRDTLTQRAAWILLALSLAGSFFWSYRGDNITQQYHTLDREPKTLVQRFGWFMLIALLLALPWIIGRSLSDAVVTIGLFVLMGFGLNIAVGLAGLLDLGYVTNYAVGAYVMAVLTSTGPLGRGPEFLNFWMVIPIALLAAMLTGFLFAVPVLKMRGDYLAIATLGFGEIIGTLAVSDWLSPIIGGAQGVLFIPKPIFFGTELKNPEQLYYIVLAACLVTLYVSIRLNNSRTGRQWMAIREDEDVASAMGINVSRAKLLAFTLSAATGGVAGAIFAAKVGTVFPNSFTVFVSINVLSLIIVGGIGSNPGVVLGAIVLVGMPELLREFSDYRWLLYGALLIFMMINRPQGLWPSQTRQREMISDEDLDEDVTAKALATDG